MSSDIQRLNQRLAGALPSATYRIIDRVAERRAQGARIISLCAGEPDFDTPGHVREAAIQAIESGHTRYTQVAGVRSLREAVAAKFRGENGLDVTWQDTLICNGGKQVIYNALAATLNEGDQVIVPAPYWVSYPEMVQLCGGEARMVTCDADAGFKLTPAALAAAITPRTRWLILNSPSNPTGAVYSRDELQALAEVLLDSPHVLVLADDIYEHLIFDDQAFFTLAQVEPRLASRTLTMNGVSKAYAMTGWRIGFATGPRWLLEAMEKLQGQQTSGSQLDLATGGPRRTGRAKGFHPPEPRRLPGASRPDGGAAERHAGARMRQSGGCLLRVRVLCGVDRSHLTRWSSPAYG